MSALMLTAALLAAPPDSSAGDTDAPAPHVPESGGKDGRIHLQLSADAIYGIGGQSYLGTLVHLDAYTAVWDRGRATGTIDFGGQFSYANEPTWLAPWIDRTSIAGANHRIQVLASLGHTFHIGKRRRFAFGTHLYAGWNHWRSAYEVDFAEVGVHGEERVTHDDAIVGGHFQLGFRVHERVGVHAVLGGPFPTQSSYLISMFHAGLGLTIHLR